MDMAEHSVVGIYDTMAQAEEVVHTLDQAGFPVKHVSIVTQSLASNKTVHGYITPGDDLTPRGAAIGAMTPRVPDNTDVLCTAIPEPHLVTAWGFGDR
jgi:hypothetical protein